MKTKSVFLLSVLLLTLAGCSSDDNENDIVSPIILTGEWEVAHRSNNPNVFDTADIWPFTFNSDGTGTWPIGTGTFRYEVAGKYVTIYLTNIEAYYGQPVFKYEIVSYSNDRMEWEEIPNEYWSNYGQHFIFYRKSRYTSQNILPSKDEEVVSTQGSWTITTYANMITKAEFNSNPPSSEDSFFKDNTPLTTDNVLKFSDSFKNTSTNYKKYDQLYKGMQVNRCGYICYYDNMDVLKSIEGAFVPIDDLDVNPRISQKEATQIIVKHLHLDNSEIPLRLQITPFYSNGIIDVRLTYLYENWYGCFSHYECFIDAHSGEILSSDFPSKWYSSN